MRESGDGVPRKPALVFVWPQYTWHHMEQVRAVADRLKHSHRVLAVQVATSSHKYAWPELALEGRGFEVVTLFPGRKAEDLKPYQIFSALLSIAWTYRPVTFFISRMDLAETIAASWLLWLVRRPAFAMMDAKFDDRPRTILRELIKATVVLPYRGAIVAGKRPLEYYAFLGIPRERIQIGYGRVSIDRVREDAGVPAAPGGTAFEERHFTIVARFVPEKNLPMALDAYRIYRQLAKTPRPLHLCGSGEGDEPLRKKVRDEQIEGVVFRGFLPASEVARELGKSLALILPSTMEPWGLVVNEALAMGVPVLCSDNVGARDELVRTAVNGFVFEPDNAAGLAQLMLQVSEDRALWRRLAESAVATAGRGDAAGFADGICRALGLDAGSSDVASELGPVPVLVTTEGPQ